VNDVLLTAVAGGVRALLQARGELDGTLVLHVSIPASIRRTGEPLGGNRVGIRIVPVPLEEPTPVLRLARVARVTRRAKRRPPLQPAGALLQRWMVGVMARQHLINILVSNLPGPPAAMTFAGAGVLEVFQIGVVQGNVPISVGVLSYAGQLNVEVAADADLVPDLPVLVAGIERDLEALSCLRRRGEPPTTPGPASVGRPAADDARVKAPDQRESRDLWPWSPSAAWALAVRAPTSGARKA